MEVISDKEQEQCGRRQTTAGASCEDRENHPSCCALWIVSVLQLHLKKPSRATDGAYSMLHLIHQSARCGSIGYL